MNKAATLNWDDLRYFLHVARTQRASAAARQLGVDHKTIGRRIRELEAALGSVLIDKSRADGFVLTPDGQRLLRHADTVETAVHWASEQFTSGAQDLSGHVRIGSTEGFGCFFLTPQIARFCDTHRGMSIDMLPVPHFVSLSKREANMAITLERPERGQYVFTRLCDYQLRLYGTRDYFGRHDAIRSVADLAFSHEPLYLNRVLPNVSSRLCSTSVIAQYHAALQGRALAILPCFMAA